MSIAIKSTRGLVARVLRVRNVKDCLKNFRKNWYFPITLFSFLLLEARMSVGYVLGMLAVTAIAAVVATQVESIAKVWKTESRAWRIFYIISAVGICWAGQTFFYNRWNESAKLASLKDALPGNLDVGMIVSVALACVGACFAALALAAFWRWLKRLLRNTSVTQLTKQEIIVYVLLFLILSAFVSLMFLRSCAFYGNDLLRGESGYVETGVIFTGDSFSSMRQLSWLMLIAPQNDCKQALFAIFSMPFVGAAYFFAKIFFLPKPLFALFLNLPQLCLLFAIVLLLAKSMRLSPVKHICFLFAAFFCFPFLLFSCMMEQYIVATFWLVLAVYLYTEKGKTDRMVLCASGGTLTTSLFFVPFSRGGSPLWEPRRWWCDMIKTGALFLAILILLRSDVICDFVSDPKSIFAFTPVASTEPLSLFDKVAQYSVFACSCFIAPNAGTQIVYEEVRAVISWLQDPVTKISVVGFVLLGLAILSAVLNRKKKIYRVSAIWLAFSFLLLCVIGYGAEENGLLLYSLYFGWPLPVLLFGLVERIGDALRARWFAPACTAVGVAVLAWYNIPAMVEMLQFATQYYPA